MSLKQENPPFVQVLLWAGFILHYLQMRLLKVILMLTYSVNAVCTINQFLFQLQLLNASICILCILRGSPTVQIHPTNIFHFYNRHKHTLRDHTGYICLLYGYSSLLSCYFDFCSFYIVLSLLSIFNLCSILRAIYQRSGSHFAITVYSTKPYELSKLSKERL